MKLSVKDKFELWGESGPYSQVNLIWQDRVLDDSVSRTFVIVEVEINPFTFHLIKKNRDEFKSDVMINQLIDHAEYRGPKYGYVASAFEVWLNDDSVLEQAEIHRRYARETVIRMHKFVLEKLKE